MARLPPMAAALAAVVAFGTVMLLSGGDRDRPARVASGGAGLEVFNRMGCGSCHRLAAARAEGPIGPSLDEALDSHTAASLRAKIVSPGETSMMPQDFGQRMSEADLDALVGFLLASRR